MLYYLRSMFVIVTMLILTFTDNSVFNSFVLIMASLTNTGEGFLYINDISQQNSFSYSVLNFLMIWKI